MTSHISHNQNVADALREVGDLLAQQGANPFRVSAYRRAADSVAHLDRDLREILAEEGLAGLVALPAIGNGLARAIRELVMTGRWSQLERLRGTLDAVALFQGIPGIGPKLAKRLHEELDADSLEALEMAAHDGRLEGVPGVGRRRAAMVRANLAAMLGRRVRPDHSALRDGPDVDLLLAVDNEYRHKAAAGLLPKIAPKRFNPRREAWLPVLHTRRGGWQLTALFSNTARAHALGRTDDWVVLYFYDDHHQEGQHTVVTETQGPLAGHRVVRGREAECRAYRATREPRTAARAA
jgi:hypothetical protein